MNRLRFITIIVFTLFSPLSFATEFSLYDDFELSSSPATLDYSHAESPQFSVNSIRVALMKKGESFIINEFSTLEEHAPIGGLDGRIYSSTRTVKRALWADLFLSAITQDERPQALIGAAEKLTSGIIIMNSSDEDGRKREFLFSFGDARFLIPQEILEPDFGFHVSLIANDSQRVNAHRSQTVALNPRSTSTEYRNPISIDDCFFRPTEIVNGIKGEGYEGGGSYVTVKKKLTLSDFPDLCQELYAFYKAPIDQEKYPWAGKILPVEGNMCETLNSKLTTALENCSNHSTWHLAKPFFEEDVALEQDAYYTIGRRATAKFNTIEDVFSHYSPMLKGKTVPQIKKMRFERNHSSKEKQLGSWSVFKCLIFETLHEQGRYILNEGSWYKVCKDYAEEVDGYVRNLFEEGKKFKQIDLPEAKENETEGAYNIRVANEKKYLLMDARDVSASAKGESKVEMCDILTPSKHLIHLKKGNESSKLSHLFAQGKVSAKTLKCDPDYRSKAMKKFIRAELIKDCKTLFGESSINKAFKDSLNLICKGTKKTALITELIKACKDKFKEKFTKKVHETFLKQCKKNKTDFEKIVPSNSFNPKYYTIVYGVIHQKNSMSDVCAVIPFFSRLNLMTDAKKIQKMGYKVFVKLIATRKKQLTLEESFANASSLENDSLLE
jgi:uncharacterized protein (TIGR04141 family)